MAHHANIIPSTTLRLSSRLATRYRSLSSCTPHRPRTNPRPQLLRLQFSAAGNLRNASSESGETSTTEQSAGTSAKKSPKRPFRRYVWITVLTLGLGCGLVYVTDTRASAHRWIVPPALRWLYPDAEDAHHVGVDMLRTLYRSGLHPRERGNPDGDGRLVTQVWIPFPQREQIDPVVDYIHPSIYAG